MRTHKKTFGKGILLLGTGLLILTGLTPGYGGEWTPVIPGVVKGTLEIKIKNMQFTNSDTGTVSDHLLVIPAGMKVKWTNMDPLVTINGDQGLMPHGIQISDDMEDVLMASPILTQKHNAFSHLFSEEGTYSYRCFIHAFMKGTIVVVAMPHKTGL